MIKSLAFLLTLMFLAGCAHAPQAEKSAAAPLTVVCYNIRIGAGPEGPFGSESPTGTLQSIADFLVESGADIVLLQEVDRKTTRVKGIDELAFLAEATSMNPAWGKAIDNSGGEYGIAVLSRHPIRDVKVHQLFQPDYSKSNPEWPGWYAEQRVALTLVTDAPSGPVQVINTHLGITEDQRAIQIPELATFVGSMDPTLPIVLGGDLNAEPKEPALDALRAVLTDSWSLFPLQPTFSTTDPNRTIDYIFVSNNLVVDTLTVEPVRHSDHLPLVAKMRRK